MSDDNTAETAQLTDDERIRRAMSRLRHGQRLMLVMFAVPGVAMVVVVLVTYLRPHRPLNMTYVGVAFALYALLIVFVCVSFSYQRRQLRPGSDRLLLASEPDRSRQVLSSLGKGRPVDPGDAALVDAQLRSLKSYRPASYLIAVVGLAAGVLGVIEIVVEASLVTGCLMVGVAVLAVAMATGLHRSPTRIRRNAASQGFPVP